MWNYRLALPRFAVPIASVENYMGDTSLLLTFPADYRVGIGKSKGTPSREKKVWFYTWFHEQIPKDSELDDIVFVSHSIRALLKALKLAPPKRYKSFDGYDTDDEDMND